MIEMKKTAAAAIFALVVSFALGAQESAPPEVSDVPESAPDTGLPTDSGWKGVNASLYAAGDKTFVISLGSTIPAFFLDASGGFLENNVYLGGTGFLGYNYYLSSSFAVGAEFGAMFASTIGANMLYIIPFGAKLTYQFVASPFEFPLSLTLGFAAQRHLSSSYFGFFAKPEASFFWRFNQDWSFGVNAAAWFLPQWGTDTGEDSYGFFQELTLAARYHF